jgi:tRNA-specific 2-thiouridylase
MSGGVDSSLAAALLHEAGYDVVGATLHLWDAQGQDQVGRCCAPEDREDARRTCDLLGVPHYVIDERAAFRAHVVEPFLDENLAGRTPSPCVHCNQQVKLGRLFELAQTLGAQAVATGHYARIEHAADGSAKLLHGLDRNKDQSYFLFGVPRAFLSRLIFPLGNLTKDQAREEAKRLGLPNWNKPDSQELCFIPDRDVAGFIARHREEAGRSGPLLDETGQTLGQHNGIEAFTVGQRRGIRLPSSQPRYVLKLIRERDAVVVGSGDQLLASELAAANASWLVDRPVAPFRGDLRIRYRHQPAPALIEPAEHGFRARFDHPQRAVAPGQAAVIYVDSRVVGGGFIT